MRLFRWIVESVRWFIGRSQMAVSFGDPETERLFRESVEQERRKEGR
jgi:hypothetical protein